MIASVEATISIQQFLYREARLLDEGRYRDWLELLSDDIRYVLPVRELLNPAEQVQVQESFHLYNDDKASIEMRVSRYETGTAHAEAPHSVTHRMISMIEILERREQSGEYLVASNFTLSQERLRHSTGVFIGSRRDTLIPHGDTWRIRDRRVQLAQTILPSTISVFF